ncbi:MAG: hypothetical protein ACXW31_10655 [Thermoanaerobaculia bacterium]
MTRSRTALFLVVVFVFIAACATTKKSATDPVYQTYGVHNPPEVSPCAFPNCRYARGPGEPADPIYPEYWQSSWTMYRVYNNYVDNPPPYDGKPPASMKEGVDYEVSWGASYYDSTYRGRYGEGAMQEYYEKRCLPIFPISNQFSCSFISLGDVAYFVTYPQDRPPGMPPVCLFSKRNHPPRRDFVAHLPYSTGDSERLGPGAQGYSFWVDAATGKPVQTGASPDRTADQAILFGYAFAPLAGVMQPSSFYFSGYPLPPANAPIVSQNYTNFTPTKPDPAKTWDQVAGIDPDTLPLCQLFDPPSTMLMAAPKTHPTWGDIGRWGRR